MHYLLLYEVNPDFVEQRAPFREEHLAFAWRAVERGELILGGALGDPVEGAALLFRAASPQIPEAFAQGDPYVQQGLVTRWTVKPWMTVVGAQAAQPIRR